MLTYVLLFGTIKAMIVYKDMLYFWIACTLVGGILLVIKNMSITNRKYRSRIIFFDILLLVLSYVLYFKINLPFFIKDLFYSVILIVYFIIYFKLLFANKLLNTTNSCENLK
jgi:hypothetical protein